MGWTRGAALSGVVALVALVVGCTPTPPPPSEPANTGPDLSTLPVLEDTPVEPWAPTTRTDELATQIEAALADGGVDLQLAVDVYSVSASVLPGATPTELPTGDGFGPSYATALLLPHLDDLTAPQRLEVERSLGVPEAELADDGTVRWIDGAADGSTLSNAAAATGVRPVAAGPSRAVKVREAATIASIHNRWRSRLPAESNFRVRLAWSNRDFTAAQGGKAWMTAYREGPTDPTCLITIYPTMWRTNIQSDLRATASHELFHCIENSWAPIAGMPGWVIEGAAEWAGLDLIRSESHRLAADGVAWMTASGRPLFARVYDAWGLYETFAEEGGDALGAIRRLIEAGPGTEVAARLAAAGMDDVRFRTAWATRASRATVTSQARWQLQVPSNPGSAGPHDNVRSGRAISVGVLPISGSPEFSHPTTYRVVDRDVGLSEVAAYGAPLAISNGSSTITVAEGDAVRLCWEAGGCVCPDGSSSNAIRMTTGDLLSAFGAAAEAGRATITSRTWDPEVECEQPERPTSHSNGDPHLLTYDGLPFDVNALGEFVVTRDPGDDAAAPIEVQTRHEVFGPDVVATGLVEAGAVGTSAVAVGVDAEHRVTFTADGFAWESPVTVRVDGDVVDRDGQAGAAAIAYNGVDPADTSDYRVWTVTWNDGTVVTLTWAWGFFAEVELPGARSTRAEGLLGASNDDFSDDLALPDGTPLPPGGDLDEQYADAWRVSEATTLFDYDPGQSPATFDLPTPDPVQIDAAAAEYCATTLPEHSTTYELAGCAYDYTVTGIDGFGTAWGTLAVESRIEETGADGEFLPEDAAPPTSPTDPRPPVAGAPSLVLAGTIDLTGGTGTTAGAVHVPKGSVIVLRAIGCTPGVELWAELEPLDAPGTGTIAAVCDPDGLNDYTLRDGDENVAGEAYALAAADVDLGIALSTNADEPWDAQLEVFVDPEPVLVNVDETAAVPLETTLSGVGDTAVVQVSGDDAAPTWSIDGADSACVVVNYDDPLEQAATPVRFLDGVCHHPSEVALSPLLGTTLPIVFFTRDDASVPVAMRLQ